MALRVAYGAGLLAAPVRLGRPWLGPDTSRAATKIGLQSLGAREVAFHAAVILAAVRGAALRPWLTASIVGDLTDIASTTARGRELPAGSSRKTVLAAGGSALLSGLLLAAVDG